MFDSLILLILGGFACYRLAELIVYDDGPFDLIYDFRRLIIRWGNGKSSKTLPGSLVLLIGCPYCVGVWCGIIVGLMLVFPSFIGNIFITIFGLAGIQSLLTGVTDGSQR
jgi:hypothetical protein